MFVLAVVLDTIRTIPENFNRDSKEVIIEQIEIKFANKVLADVGLCICFYDFVEVGDPYVYPGEGSAHQRVKFRLVVFRPFVGEILVGKLISSSTEGIKVSLDFFDDVFIPAHLLQSPSEYRGDRGLWVWSYDEESEGQFVYEPREEIRFRVRTINFTKVTTNAKGVLATTTSETTVLGQPSNQINALHKSSASGLNDATEDTPITIRRRSSSVGLLEEDAVPAVMQIIGGVNEDGLGPVAWWTA